VPARSSYSAAVGSVTVRGVVMAAVAARCRYNRRPTDPSSPAGWSVTTPGLWLLKNEAALPEVRGTLSKRSAAGAYSMQGGLHIPEAFGKGSRLNAGARSGVTWAHIPGPRLTSPGVYLRQS